MPILNQKHGIRRPLAPPPFLRSYPSTKAGCPILPRSFWKGGNHEPQPAVFFFESFAEICDWIVHTIQEKGSAMGGTARSKSRARRSSRPLLFISILRFFAPKSMDTHPLPCGKPLSGPSSSYNILGINNLHFIPINERVT